MNKRKISVIIPVFNAEMYLSETLESIASQTFFDDIEAILIDDGSTDRSLEICCEYSKRYSNIHVFSQPNSGVSCARNLGLEKANGEYIVFVDADDTVSSDLFEKMHHLINCSGADMSIVDFDVVHPNAAVKKHRRSFSAEIIGRECIYKGFFSGTIGNNVFDKIVKADIAKNAKFPEGIRIGEDMDYVYQLLASCSKVAIDTSICGYHYMVRENSAMTRAFDERFFEPVRLSRKMVESMMEDTVLVKYAHAHLAHEECKLLEKMYLNKAGGGYRAEKEQLLRDLRKYILADVKPCLSNRQFCGLILMRFSPGIYMFMHKLMKIG